MSCRLTIPQLEALAIRQATEHDRSAILALMRQRDYNRMNLDPSCFLVATLPPGAESARIPAIIGIGQIKRHWDGTPELASLVVAEHVRRQGVGSTLMRALIAHHFHADRTGDSGVGDDQSTDSALRNKRELAQNNEAQRPPQPLYLFCLATLESYYRQFGFRQVAGRSLPWPLYLMHRIGNGVGRLAQYGGAAGFSVIAMRLDAFV